MKKTIILFTAFFVLLTSMSFVDRGGSDSLNIYPQPIVKVARVSSDLAVQKVEVYTLLGTKVLERENQGELDFSDLPGGYYIIKAYTSKGELIKRVQKN